MKKFLGLLVFLPFLLGANTTTKDIFQALASGDADALGLYFDQQIEVVLTNKEGRMAKTEAIQAVKTFFAQNKPSGFSNMHQGDSKNSGAKYAIGNLTTASGTYRVYVYMKYNGATPVIQEIRIDKG